MPQSLDTALLSTSLNIPFSLVAWQEFTNHPGKKLHGVRKNALKEFLGHTGLYFPKMNSKIDFISTANKKDINILSQVAKKLQSFNLRKTA